MSEYNPYAPPAAPLAEPMPLRRATRGQRFATMLLDSLFYYLFAFLIGVVFVSLGMERVLERIPDLLLGALIMLVYYAPQEAYSGRTLGKRIMKTQVVNADGQPITGKQAVLRTLGRFIPFEALTFLGGGEEGPCGLHDNIARTIVVTTRPAQDEAPRA
jgi:uncharacterized RDD family membrane protein YckC